MRTSHKLLLFGQRSNIITSIFADGTDGFYFDFSKTDRLFQTQAGLTLADDAGENIAFALENHSWGSSSYAAIVAAATELFPDGGMSDASTGWTYSNASGSIVSGALRLTSTAVGAAARTAYKTLSGLTVGVSYRVSVDVVGTGGTAGGAATSLLQALTTAGAGVQNSESAAGTGTRSLIFVATATSHRIQVRFDGSGGDATTYVDFDNLSVKAIPGNHGRQSTTSAQPKWQTGGIARFDGSDDNLPTVLYPSAAAMTLMADVTVGAIGAARVFMGCIGAGTQRLSISVTAAGVLSGSLGDQFSTTIVDPGGTDRSGQRLRVALTCNGSTVRLYANGTQVYSGAQVGAPATDQPIAVGAYNNAGVMQNFFNGDIYKGLAIKKALTAAEIAAITNLWGTS